MLPSHSQLLFFISAALILLAIPGPAVLYIVGRSIGQGRNAGYVSALGIGVGTLVHTAAAAVGLSALLVSSAAALASSSISAPPISSFLAFNVFAARNLSSPHPILAFRAPASPVSLAKESSSTSSIRKLLFSSLLSSLNLSTPHAAMSLRKSSPLVSSLLAWAPPATASGHFSQAAWPHGSAAIPVGRATSVSSPAAFSSRSASPPPSLARTRKDRWLSG